MPRRSNGKDKQLTRGLANGIQMVVVVPEHLIHAIRGKQSGVVRDRVRAIEVEYL